MSGQKPFQPQAGSDTGTGQTWSWPDSPHMLVMGRTRPRHVPPAERLARLICEDAPVIGYDPKTQVGALAEELRASADADWAVSRSGDYEPLLQLIGDYVALARKVGGTARAGLRVPCEDAGPAEAPLGLMTTAASSGGGQSR